MLLPAIPNLPWSCIRLRDASFTEADQIGDQRFMIFGSQINEPVIEEDRSQRKNHLAVHVALYMFGCLVMAPDGSAPKKALPVGMLNFRKGQILTEFIHRRQAIVGLLTGIADIQKKL